MSYTTKEEELRVAIHTVCQLIQFGKTEVRWQMADFLIDMVDQGFYSYLQQPFLEILVVPNGS